MSKSLKKGSCTRENKEKADCAACLYEKSSDSLNSNQRPFAHKYHIFCRYLYIYYLPSGLFVVVSWTSFLIPPEIIPGRMALLVTLGRHSMHFITGFQTDRSTFATKVFCRYCGALEDCFPWADVLLCPNVSLIFLAYCID